MIYNHLSASKSVLSIERYERDPDSQSSTTRLVLSGQQKLVCEGLCKLFEACDEFDVIAQASSSREALLLIRELHPDIAIFDGNMPLEILKRLDAADRWYLQAKLVFLATHLNPLGVIEAQQAGFNAYVSKHSSFDELLLAMRIVLAGGTFVSPSVTASNITVHCNPLMPLSTREREVLRWLALGKSTKQIARDLKLSPKTVDTYRTRIMKKLDMHSAVELTGYAFRAGLVW